MAALRNLRLCVPSCRYFKKIILIADLFARPPCLLCYPPFAFFTLTGHAAAVFDGRALVFGGGDNNGHYFNKLSDLPLSQE